MNLEEDDPAAVVLGHGTKQEQDVSSYFLKFKIGDANRSSKVIDQLLLAKNSGREKNIKWNTSHSVKADGKLQKALEDTAEGEWA
jgi:hypothetical protein